MVDGFLGLTAVEIYREGGVLDRVLLGAVAGVLGELAEQRGTYGKGDSLGSVRESQVRFLDRDLLPEAFDAVGRFLRRTRDALAPGVPLQGPDVTDALQIGRYPAGLGHYDWHRDYGGGHPTNRRRVVSCSVLLSATPSDHLEVAGFGRIRLLPGEAVGFRADLMHRVHVGPVDRLSLVGWALRPAPGL